ncbi:uncharacterized protein LOC106883820 [Octopus bimaculoides]|uniref:uncharacterized protein LOC106883820 n=1 Tax=Octopus bimaculoides TaxID=37653 RepID=UPI00071DAD4D|nr:uncharacterized protein LOC106883820 [Octopus bimaculoides]|eukprot:XP_014790447.1 PREDICTED: uncharacterized protein LOC106883820 [Octopus bimaculoides]
MVATLGRDDPALSTVYKWAAEFRRGRESLEDDPRSDHHATVTTEENVDRVHRMDDRQLTINRTANAISIYRVRLENILHNELDMMSFAWWDPRLLIPDQKRTRMITSQENLKFD